MQEEFIKKMTLDSDIFDQLRTDANFVLQRLIGNMFEKESDEGTMTLKLEISFDNEFIPNYDKNVDGETREIHKPKFKHKITSSVQIKDEKSGNMDSEMELVMDENGCYVLKPIANTEQRSLFDDDFQDEKENETEEQDDSTALPGRKIMGLPGEVSDPGVIDVEATEITEAPGENDQEEPADATGALFDDEFDPKDLPLADDGEDNNDDDGYSYDDPAEEE